MSVIEDLSTKTGDAAERELCKYLNEHGMVMRAAGSGSVDRPCPDVFAAQVGNRFGIEVKTTTVPDKTIYLDKAEVTQLQAWCQVADADAYFAVNMPSLSEMRLVAIDAIERASDTRYKISPRTAHVRGDPVSEVFDYEF